MTHLAPTISDAVESPRGGTPLDRKPFVLITSNSLNGTLRESGRCEAPEASCRSWHTAHGGATTERR